MTLILPWNESLHHTRHATVIWEPDRCFTINAPKCKVVNLITAEKRAQLEAGTHLYTFEIAVTSSAPSA